MLSLVEMSSASETGLDLMGWDRDAPMLSKLGLSSRAEPHPKTGPSSEPRPTARPSHSVMTGGELTRNPNTC